MNGTGNEAWTFSPPTDPSGTPNTPQLAVDQGTGQPSVMYRSASTIVAAALVESDPAANTYQWSRRTVTGPISFAGISADLGTNDHVKQEWYSASDGVGTVTWMQNDATISSAAPSDVGGEAVDLGILTGEAIDVSGASSVVLDGNAATGVVTVTADGVANSYNFGVPLVQVSVAGAGNTSVTLNQTTSGTPLPAVYGVQFDNSTVASGTLTLTGAGSTKLTPSLLATTTGDIALSNLSGATLGLDGNNDTVTLARDMSDLTGTPFSFAVSGGGADSHLVLSNTSASSATTTFSNQQIQLGSLAASYDGSIDSIEIDGPNSIPNLDLSAGVNLPVGTAAYPGLIDLSAQAPITITDIATDDDVLYASGGQNYWHVGGRFLAVSVGLLKLGDGRETVSINAVPDAALEIDDGNGNDDVTIANGVRILSLAHDLTVLGGAGNDTVTQDNQNSPTGKLIFTAGSGPATLVIGAIPDSVAPSTVFNGGLTQNALNVSVIQGIYKFATDVDPSWTQWLNVSVAKNPMINPQTPMIEFDQSLALKSLTLGDQTGALFTQGGSVETLTIAGTGVATNSGGSLTIGTVAASSASTIVDDGQSITFSGGGTLGTLSLTGNVIFPSATVAGGTLAIGNLAATSGAIAVGAGAALTVASTSGIGSLSIAGGGTLTVSGGGAFAVGTVTGAAGSAFALDGGASATFVGGGTLGTLQVGSGGGSATVMGGTFTVAAVAGQLTTLTLSNGGAAILSSGGSVGALYGDAGTLTVNGGTLTVGTASAPGVWIKVRGADAVFSGAAKIGALDVDLDGTAEF